jgi:FkbM family methyltransferase
MKNFLIKCICAFIPSKEKRCQFRAKYYKPYGSNWVYHNGKIITGCHDIIYGLINGAEDFKCENGMVEINGIKFDTEVIHGGYEEIFVKKYYEFGGLENCVFIDAGANIGDSALYAASLPNVSKVYSYEVFQDVFQAAQKNVSLNPDLAGKIELFNYGLSDKTGTVEVQLLPYFADASNSIETFFYETIKDKKYLDKSINVDVRKCSDVFKEIFDKHPNQPVCLKMDIEGSEYVCMQDLAENDLLKHISAINVEWHYKGYDTITALLEQNGFVWFNEKINNRIGIIKAVRK